MCSDSLVSTTATHTQCVHVRRGEQVQDVELREGKLEMESDMISVYGVQVQDLKINS